MDAELGTVKEEFWKIQGNIPKKNAVIWRASPYWDNQQFKDVSYPEDDTDYGDGRVWRLQSWGDDNQENFLDDDDDNDKDDDNDGDQGNGLKGQDLKDVGRKRERDDDEGSGEKEGQSSNISSRQRPGTPGRDKTSVTHQTTQDGEERLRKRLCLHEFQTMCKCSLKKEDTYLTPSEIKGWYKGICCMAFFSLLLRRACGCSK